MYNRDLEWFRNRIGRVIFSNATCECSVCHQIYLKGVKVQEVNHARHLYLNHVNNSKFYFDSKEDRIEWERSQKG